MPVTFEYADDLNRDNALSDAEAMLQSCWSDDPRDIRPQFSDDTPEQARCHCVLLVDGSVLWKHDFGILRTAKDIADTLDDVLD